MNSIEDNLEELKQKAEENFEKADKEYPIPVNMPVGLLDCIENGRWETAYTRTLAYLLGCNKHGYGKRFLEALLGKKVSSADYMVCAEKALLKEKGRFDVYVAGELVIEAKTVSVAAGDLLNQLQKYNNELGNEILKLSLTVEPVDMASSGGWKNITWEQMAETLWEVVKDEPNKPGYWFVKYFICSIYANLYGCNSDYIDICDYLEEADLEETAADVTAKGVDFAVFKKYPSAIFALYDGYTEENSVFDKSCDQCVNRLKEEIEEVFRNELAIKELHRPASWNVWCDIAEGVDFNIGVTNKVNCANGKFEDGLYWFYNVNFSGKQRTELLQKLKEEFLLKSNCKFYSNDFLGLEGDNLILFVGEYDKKEIFLKNLKNDFSIIKNFYGLK